MIDSEIQSISSLIYEPGEPFEFGCDVSEASAFIELAEKKFPDKPYCVAKDWVIWNAIVTEQQRQALGAISIQPVFVYVNFVIEDEYGHLNRGNYRRSTALVEMLQPCFFVTRNTIYILTGPGTRKDVNLKDVFSIYFE